MLNYLMLSHSFPSLGFHCHWMAVIMKFQKLQKSLTLFLNDWLNKLRWQLIMSDYDTTLYCITKFTKSVIKQELKNSIVVFENFIINVIQWQLYATVGINGLMNSSKTCKIWACDGRFLIRFNKLLILFSQTSYNHFQNPKLDVNLNELTHIFWTYIPLSLKGRYHVIYGNRKTIAKLFDQKLKINFNIVLWFP